LEGIVAWPPPFHDLRHTAAILLLGRGVHPKIVSEMLGHGVKAPTRFSSKVKSHQANHS
jgi:integrase